MMKYGVISDVHSNPGAVRIAVEVLKNEGIDKLLINGDIGEKMPTDFFSYDYLATVLEAIGKSNIEAWVQPGSHETIDIYHTILKAMQSKYSNLIDAIDNKILDEKGHQMVFLPGSDFVSGGEYRIIDQENIPSGYYMNGGQQGLIPIDVNEGIPGMPLVYISNMNDLKSIVKEPEKTVVVCHVPRKFDDPAIGVDMAYFAKTERGVMPGAAVEQQIREKFGNVTSEAAEYIARQNGIDLRRENRGNEGLKKLYSELGITKAVSGHFHESSHRAHDGNCRPVAEETLVEELYWNSGQLDLGKTGILYVEGNKVGYRNISLM